MHGWMWSAIPTMADSGIPKGWSRVVDGEGRGRRDGRDDGRDDGRERRERGLVIGTEVGLAYRDGEGVVDGEGEGRGGMERGGMGEGEGCGREGTGDTM